MSNTKIFVFKKKKLLLGALIAVAAIIIIIFLSSLLKRSDTPDETPDTSPGATISDTPALTATPGTTLKATPTPKGTKKVTPTPAPGATPEANLYVPGVYTTVIALNDTYLNLEVVVDANHINSVRIVNTDEAITTMYPLVESSITSISEQLCNDIPLESVTFNEESKYTQSVLLDAVEIALDKARVGE